ncbi:MAG: hypothetical protein LBO74_02000 [Candidatus Symbiothrix sp.]|jgi:hypothetical protein|nr:hypothetical protein [Candidatus Symbiothrix sp.]
MESLNTVYQTNMNRFFAGILIYSIATGLLFYILPGAVVNIIQLAALMLYVFYWTKLASLQNIPTWYLRIIIFIFLAWQCYIIYHGFIFNYPYVKEYLFSPDRFVQYLVPLVLFIPINNSAFLQKLFSYIYQLGLFFLVAFPFLFFFLIHKRAFAEQYIWTLAMGSGLTLLTAFYHSKRRFGIALAAMLLGLLLATVTARRSIMLSCGCFLLFAFFIFILTNKTITLLKKLGFICLVVLISIAGYGIYISNQGGMFSKITERAGENTREVVFLAYFLDMTETDLAIGKGINGTYYCPGVDEDWIGHALSYKDLDNRIYIECGYLQLVLNGGIVYLALFLLVLFPAIVLGLGFSKNVFSKGCALLILLWLIDMAPYGLPSFTLRYFLVWFCVALCFSKAIRTMNDEDIKALLYPEKTVL